jgi:dienelactone hydrolase
MKYLFVLFFTIALAACSDSDSGVSRNLVSFADAPGPFAVGKRTDVAIRDSARSRDVTTTFWYPTNGENTGPEQADEGAGLITGKQIFPLVVLVHGIEDSAPATWPYLAPHLASHGYIVVAPSTGSTFTTSEDLVNHPGDVSFLIDTVLGKNQTENMFLERIDEDKIAVGGFSFGGAATYMLVYNPLYKDPRIKAAIIMAGGRDDPAPVNPNINLLTIFGTEDILIPYDFGLNIYEAANPPKYLVTLEGGGHVGFTSSNDVNIGASMDQSRQQALVRLSVFAYLTSVFDTRVENRVAARNFLINSFAELNSDVEVFAELDL